MSADLAAAPLLQVQDLAVRFRADGRSVDAVRACNLELYRGRILALVGESGSGKSTLARAISGIVAPWRGEIRFLGQDLRRARGPDGRALRRKIQMVFQGPDASLNPYHRIHGILAEPLLVAGEDDPRVVQDRVSRLLALVRLDDSVLERRPRQLSGGQKQRIAIARALAAGPALLIADEALTSVDAASAAVLATLLRSLATQLDIGILCVSHDLGIVRSIADEVAVMYRGEIVERGTCAQVFQTPAHPYTRILLAATPSLARRGLDLALIDEIERLQAAMAPMPGDRIMNVRTIQHSMLPQLTPEERSRQRSVVALRRLINSALRPRNLQLYESEGLPTFEARHGRTPETPAEVNEALFDSAGYRIWSALNRSAQEMLWISVGEPVLREGERLEAEAARLAGSYTRRGSLQLDSSFTPPPEIAGTDIHLQPGGYALDRGEHDVVAGALYENGGNVYSFGQGIGQTDSKAAAVINYLNAVRPGHRPGKILEIGCSAGAAACAYAAHYPEAEVHAIDIGAGMLRYAHARAESVGVRVMFHQMSGAALAFPDASFDLVVTNNLLHEIGRENRRAMLREARRVLVPGGIAIHQDVPTRFEASLVQQVERGWDQRFNGEIFWNDYAKDDLVADMRAAGFAQEEIAETRIEKTGGPGEWYLLSGAKPR